MKLELDNLVKIIRETVRSHELSTPGEYARWIWNDEQGSRNLGSSEYGCADAANILYIIGDFEREPEKRAAAVKALQALQACSVSPPTTTCTPPPTVWRRWNCLMPHRPTP